MIAAIDWYIESNFVMICKFNLNALVFFFDCCILLTMHSTSKCFACFQHSSVCGNKMPTFLTSDGLLMELYLATDKKTHIRCRFPLITLLLSQYYFPLQFISLFAPFSGLRFYFVPSYTEFAIG